MQDEMSLSHDAEAIDYKVTKRHYPRTNNQNCLEFVLEKDPNLFLRKNKIIIKGAIECDKNYLPENGFAAKLFSMLTVEIDSQQVTKNNNKAEFFLEDYMYKIGNFNGHMIHTCFNPEGYYDHFNSDSDELASPGGKNVIELRQYAGHKDGTDIRYEFALCPNVGYLASPDLLMKDCELKITFDRAAVENALVKIGEPTTVCKTLEIKDCVAITEYVSSPGLRQYFERIDTTPIVYEYDDCDVLLKSIPNNVTTVRFDSLRGGNVPDYIFAAVIPQACLNGTFSKSSTYFHQHGVNEVNFTLNGNSVNGYPMSVNNNSPIYPMQKFFDVTNRFYNVGCGQSFNTSGFKYNFIWAHKFEGEITGQGWVGCTLKLDEAYNESMTLVVWIINSTAITLDKFHQIERLSL